MIAKTKEPRRAAPPVAVLIEVDRIDPWPGQPRQEFAAAELGALAESIKADTLRQPITVESSDSAAERYRLLAGERRWRATKLAGLTVIPAFVRHGLARSDAARIVAEDNLQARPLNPVETARALELLTRPKAKGGGGMTHAAVAKQVGHDPSWVTNHLRLLALPATWLAEVSAGRVCGRAARALASYADRPDVLAAVAADRDANPQDWESARQFEARLQFVVARLEALAAHPAGAIEPADVSQETPAAPVVLPLKRSAPVDHAAPAALAKIAELVAMLTTVAELEKVQTMIDARLRELAPRRKAK